MIIGIDTSCYTTSLAIVDQAGEMVANCRRLLQVKAGEKGLRQSDAVFQHVQNLAQLLEQPLKPGSVSLVVASTIPRPIEGSYLPVFSVGTSFGKMLAQICGVPFCATSHQEGHIRAGLYGQTLPEQPFLAWHISGGTSELLVVKPQTSGYAITKIGGSNDLHVGQLVDRIGVGLGAPFPAGPFLEELAMRAQPTGKPLLPVAVKDLEVSFSGPASAAERLIAQGMVPEKVAWEVFRVISRSLWQVTLKAVSEYRINQVLMVGGVASNRLIREFLLNAGIKQGIDFQFGLPQLSSDNAVGTALIGFDRLSNQAREVTVQ